MSSAPREPSLERLTFGRSVMGTSIVHAHAYRIGSTLVDAGPPRRANELSARLDGIGITDVLLTHGHEDHVGAAGRLADQGATVHAPEGSLGTLEDPPQLPGYRRWAWGRPASVKAEPLDDHVETSDGRFQVIPTPGHSSDHVAFYEPDRGWLFSGDAFLGGRTEVRFREHLPEVYASLGVLRDLEAERLHPGHGPVRDDPSKALTEARRHLETLVDRAGQLARDGWSLASIRRRLLGLEGPLYYVSRGEFSKTNLVRQALKSGLSQDPTSPTREPSDAALEGGIQDA